MYEPIATLGDTDMKSLAEMAATNEKDPTRHWTFGVDDWMDVVAYDILILGKIPTHKQAVDLLSFLACFAVGFRRMGIDDLADIYNDRCNRYVAMLSKVGFKRGTFERERFQNYQPLGDIISWASGAIKDIGPVK